MHCSLGKPPQPRLHFVHTSVWSASPFAEPQERDFGEFLRHIKAAGPDSPLIFNCQVRITHTHLRSGTPPG